MFFRFIIFALISTASVTTSFQPSLRLPSHALALTPTVTRLFTSTTQATQPKPSTKLFSTPSTPSTPDDEITPNPTPTPTPTPELSRFRKTLSKMNPFKQNDEIPLKEQLLKLGLAAFLAYGFVSNMTYAVMLSLAYYVFTSQTGVSPLMPGQKAPFLAVYTTFFVINNFLRPVRLAVAASISVYFENFIKFLQKRLKLNRVFATGLVIFLFNVVGTFAAMYVGVNIAALCSGVSPQIGLLFGRG
mmetsp:Transcript_10918/g.19755  ORF Transcript_10918/g.19755 Transcript_10918/m.19755 type:complete len:245 (+) Transcript_10918:113-847(+)|eukprot:CAMPEP_0182504498 /NCGR_PEP_ID=MMETSP1321-20130603/17319_1 /TAXON_ID=91990 /ORGANISM="Bolidomonas sp., Strain RCC1657" /LENGTH=244 /DNA_ID=CAMNT_0024709867 /DNA_START=50 /DNA_END=784 /DNA_ORIENTATION=-